MWYQLVHHYKAQTEYTIPLCPCRFCSMADGVFTNMHPNFSTLRVIVCTCAAAAMLHEDPTKSRVSFVTHIFIDEAGQVHILTRYNFFKYAFLVKVFDCTVFKAWYSLFDS